MAYIDDITEIRDNLVAELKGETAARKALVLAGKPPPTTYTANGRNVDWNGYLEAMRKQIQGLTEEIGDNELDPFELNVEMFP